MSEDEITMNVVHVPVMDTGIGRAAGFENDAALAAHDAAERAKLSPEARAILERWDEEMLRSFLFGDR